MMHTLSAKDVDIKKIKDTQERVKRDRAMRAKLNDPNEKIIKEHEEKKNIPELQFYFAMTPEKFLRDEEISLAAKGLYGLICTFCFNKKYKPWTDKLNRKTLAKYGHTTEKIITKLEQELVNGGWMKMKRQGFNKPNKLSPLQVKKRK